MIPHPLCIFSFSTMKKVVNVLISLVTVFLLLIMGLKGVRYLVTDDTKSFTRLMMHELYSQEENIDYLFVGSSHCYRSVVPTIADEKLGGHSFNCGSSAQKLDGSLVLVKEVLKNNCPKEIVLDVYYEMIDTIPHSEREELTSTYALADYMPFSVNKVMYLLNASSSDYYFNSFIIGRRNWRKLFDFDYIREIWNKKHQKEYKEYEWAKSEFDEGYYAERGYVAFEGQVENVEDNTDSIRIDIDKFTDEWKAELDEIIQICKDKGIKLTVVAAPLPDKTLSRIENYTDYMKYISELLTSKNVSYFDFNNDELKIKELDESCFMDGDHLNSKGAEIYTEVLADCLLKAR